MPDIRLSFLIGMIAGSRTMTAPAAVSWAARLGRVPLQNTGLSVLGAPATAAVLTALAVGELIADKLPATPSRTVPAQFTGRLASGGLCGAAVAMPQGDWPAGLAAGVAGAFIGTLAGAAARSALVKLLGNKVEAAMVEDALAIGSAAILLNSRAAAYG